MLIRFHQELYHLNAVKKALTAYKHLAWFRLSSKGKYYLVSLNRIEPTVKNILPDEFANYVLSCLK